MQKDSLDLPHQFGMGFRAGNLQFRPVFDENLNFHKFKNKKNKRKVNSIIIRIKSWNQNHEISFH